MYLGVDYFPVDAAESLLLGIDFVNDLSAGDTVSSATVTCTVSADSQVPDATPSARITGGPFYPNTTQVTFRFTSGVAGCKYTITITATTAVGAEIVSDYTHIPCEQPL